MFAPQPNWVLSTTKKEDKYVRNISHDGTKWIDNKQAAEVKDVEKKVEARKQTLQKPMLQKKKNYQKERHLLLQIPAKWSGGAKVTGDHSVDLK